MLAGQSDLTSDISPCRNQEERMSLVHVYYASAKKHSIGMLTTSGWVIGSYAVAILHSTWSTMSKTVHDCLVGF